MSYTPGLDLSGTSPEQAVSMCLEKLQSIRHEAESLRTQEERAERKEEVKAELRQLMRESDDPEFHRVAAEVIAGRMSRFTLYEHPAFVRVVQSRQDRAAEATTYSDVDVPAAARRVLDDLGHGDLLALLDHYSENWPLDR